MFVFASLTLASCMNGDDELFNDDWTQPTDEAEYGNPNIAESNVISIAELKQKYKTTFFGTLKDYKQVTEDMQIKGVVTGNDIEGNIYSQIALQDYTVNADGTVTLGDAIIVCISQGGLFTYLPVGQVITIDLKDLYVGNYGYQPEIGTPYTNSKGSTYVSRMDKFLWQKHFKMGEKLDASKIVPEEFDASKYKNNDEYMQANCGRLMTLKGVTLKGADGNTTFAPEEDKDGGNAVPRYFTGFTQSYLTLRTSCYADFAAAVMPSGKLNVTGIFSRYNDTWQIMARESADIAPAE